jgi:hypothetical protein
MAVFSEALSDATSDLSGGADFDNQITSIDDGNTLAVTIAGQSTESSFGYTNAGTPNNADWENGNWTVEVDVQTANMNITVEPRIDRVSSTGSFLEDSDATVSPQSMGTTGIRTFIFLGATWDAGNASDRIRVEYVFVNSQHGEQSVTMNVDTTNSEVVGPIEDNTVGAVETPGVLAIKSRRIRLAPIRAM